MNGYRACPPPYRSALASAAVVVGLWPAVASAQVAIDSPDAGASTDAIPLAAPTSALAPAASAPDHVAVQFGVRTLAFLQDPDASDDLGDLGGTGEADVVVSGTAHPFLKWQVGFAGILGDPATVSRNNAAVLDLIAKVEIAEALNLWLGRMPVPSDRASLSTVWAIAPWTLPGHYEPFAKAAPAGVVLPAGPRQGNILWLDRSDGATLWGQLRGGRLKYYAGAFGFTQPELSPLYSARVALDLLAPEPGYRTTSSYYGAKDVLALGVGFQHQTDGSKPGSGADPTATAGDFDEANADLLFEMGSDAAGVLDVEAAFAKLWGKNEAFGYQSFGLLSYLVPIEIGFGRFQPLLRLQHAGAGDAAGAVAFTAADAQLGYIVDGRHARISAGWSYIRWSGQTANAILLGVQLLSRSKER